MRTRYGTLALRGTARRQPSPKTANIDWRLSPELGGEESKIASIPCRIVKRSPGGAPSAEFVCEQSHLSALWNLCWKTVKANRGGPVGYNALNALRLETGSPGSVTIWRKANSAMRPASEKSHISYTKGCYTARKSSKRVRSRGQVNRVRALFKLSSSAFQQRNCNSIRRQGSWVRHGAAAEYTAFQSSLPWICSREQSFPGTECRLLERAPL